MAIIQTCLGLATPLKPLVIPSSRRWFPCTPGSAVGFGRLKHWHTLPLCVLISWTLWLIKAIPISDDSGVIHGLSYISWCILYIAATVSYCSAAIGNITHCQCLSSYTAALVQPCQWQHGCGGAIGERLRLDRQTWVTFAPGSTKCGWPGICSSWTNSRTWLWQCSC